MFALLSCLRPCFVYYWEYKRRVCTQNFHIPNNKQNKNSQKQEQSKKEGLHLEPHQNCVPPNEKHTVSVSK